MIIGGVNLKKFLNFKSLLLLIAILAILLFILIIPKKQILEGEVLRITETSEGSLGDNLYLNIKVKTKNNETVWLHKHKPLNNSSIYNDIINSLGMNVRIEYKEVNCDDCIMLDRNNCIIERISTIDTEPSSNIIDVLDSLEIKSADPIFLDTLRASTTPGSSSMVYTDMPATKYIDHIAPGETIETYHSFPEKKPFCIKKGVGRVQSVPIHTNIKLFYVEYDNEKVIIDYEQID